MRRIESFVVLDDKQVAQAFGDFYPRIFDSAIRYFQEEYSNCAKLFSTADGRVELARMVVVRILAEASYQLYTNDTADSLYEDSSVSEDTVRLVVARENEIIGQIDELLDMIYPVICDVNHDSGLLPHYAQQSSPQEYDF